MCCAPFCGRTKGTKTPSGFRDERRGWGRRFQDWDLDNDRLHAERALFPISRSFEPGCFGLVHTSCPRCSRGKSNLLLVAKASVRLVLTSKKKKKITATCVTVKSDSPGFTIHVDTMSTYSYGETAISSPKRRYGWTTLPGRRWQRQWRWPCPKQPGPLKTQTAPPNEQLSNNRHLCADVRDVVVHRPVLRYRRPCRPAGDPARGLEDRGHADEAQESPPLPESRQRGEHLEGEADVVRGVCEQSPSLHEE